ncbi:cytochrome c553 [Luteibacter rhizovicinus]|uniref:Cytochrome c553 n=1 Tax=Luteibacter rhizovicinus TaxID=242606 RepID=A0A4R3YI45_9GAMM|nr:c-type cytochrome [Luteibacter rhizovicinus]TCV92315.1 cytochrome c553 [Luteibacter rhizovicinus]
MSTIVRLIVAASFAWMLPCAAADAPVKPLDLRRVETVHGDATAGTAKAAVCAACHGPAGVAIAPTFPNLAGQSATYVYIQLKEYKEGQRANPIMTGQAAGLSDADMRDLAAHYAALAPKAAGRPDASSRGAVLYLAGDPTLGVPPCQGCHGTAGRGPKPAFSSSPQPSWHSFPSLAGQSSLYVTQQLGDYRTGTRVGSSNASVMHGVTQNLSDADIAALSSYIESL